MPDRYEQARTVGITQIAAEMGWSVAKARHQLINHYPLVVHYRKPRRQYDARVLDVLKAIYGHDEPPPLPGQDFLSRFLNKEIADARRSRSRDRTEARPTRP